MNNEQQLVTLGKVGAVYGIKGWLKIHSFTDDPEAILDYFPWSLKLGSHIQSVEVTDWRKHNNGLVAKLAKFDDRNQAQTLVGAEILVNRAALPALPEGEYYWRDLMGMNVVNVQGYNLGTVTDMMETGANDVLVVKANLQDAFGQKERLIPYLYEQVIKSVCLETKKINVDWDPGF